MSLEADQEGATIAIWNSEILESVHLQMMREKIKAALKLCDLQDTSLDVISQYEIQKGCSFVTLHSLRCTIRRNVIVP